LKDIIRIKREFDDLRIDLWNLYLRLGGSQAQISRSAQRPEDLPTLEQIAAQIHEALGHPQQSARERRRMEDEKNAEASLLADVPTPQKRDVPNVTNTENPNADPK
jgi:hypothetical protein